MSREQLLQRRREYDAEQRSKYGVVFVRLSKVDHALIKQAADLRRTSVAEWCRDVLLDAAVSDATNKSLLSIAGEPQ